MNAGARRRRVQAVALAIFLGGSALEAMVLATGQTVGGEALLLVIAATMAMAAVWG